MNFLARFRRPVSYCCAPHQGNRTPIARHFGSAGLGALMFLLATECFGAGAAAPATNADAPWWQSGAIYQIYPRSFQDSNGDGKGDLTGIAQRLDYVNALGVDAIWLSPFSPSPMKDFGYDISNYKDVDPIFGNLADFDALVSATHARRMKVVIDFVPNHTSNEHPWFRASRATRKNPKRDWYVWRDPAPGGGPPNNWRSVFGGSAWTRDPATGQYYYHAFLPEQPDLNWRNPEVRAAMLDVLRFWLDRGVDGFRVDAIAHLVEDSEFRDDSPNPAETAGQTDFDKLLHTRTVDLPETHAVVRDMRNLVDTYAGQRVLITEAYLPFAQQVAYYGKAGAPEAQLPFNFHLIGAPFQADAVGKIIGEYEASLPPGAWPNWVLGNHDQSRLATRLGAEQVRVAAMLLLTLRGTPTLYNGDEIGMHDGVIAPREIRDPVEKREPGKGRGRDPERTPMQWDASPHAGFSAAVPWLPVAADFAERNTVAQASDPGSVLALYRELFKLRRREVALALGSYRRLEAPPNVLAFERQLGARRLVVALNFAAEARDVTAPGRVVGTLLSTLKDAAPPRSASTSAPGLSPPPPGSAAPLKLRPHEGVIVEMAPNR